MPFFYVFFYLSKPPFVLFAIPTESIFLEGEVLFKRVKFFLLSDFEGGVEFLFAAISEVFPSIKMKDKLSITTILFLLINMFLL